MGRGCLRTRFKSFATVEDTTAPVQKYSTPADLVYRRAPAVRAVTVTFVLWLEIVFSSNNS